MAEKQYDVSWPGWNVVGIIGYGSYGRVYKIERDVYGHTEKAALKVISIPQNDAEIEELYNDGYDSESITQRFKSHLQDIVREYSLMSEMKGHTNIVYCDDLRCVQHDDGMGWDIYIKMELLTPLPKILVNGFSEDSVIKLALDMCNALILCKSRNIVHRDIKPQNIFVSADGDFKLGDFGIAKTAERTTSGTKTGTYKYMAPEVYNNQPYGHSADLYSLGMVLYWLLNERRTPFLPLPPQVPTATDEEHARDSRFAGFPIPEPLHGSDALKRIVLKACAFWPEDRYKNAAEMRKDLLSLARNGTYTSLNQHIKSPAENEPKRRIPVPDTDETVGNFGHIQKEETPSEETVSDFGGRSADELSTTKTTSKKRKISPILIGVSLCATAIIASTVVFSLFRGVTSYLLFHSNKNKYNAEISTSMPQEYLESDVSVTAESTYPEAPITVSEQPTEVPTTIPTGPSDVQAVFLQTAYWDNQGRSTTYQYNEDGTLLYRLMNKEFGEYYIYDDGTLTEQIENLAATGRSQTDIDEIKQKINALLNSPTEPVYWYCIIKFDEQQYPVQRIRTDADLNVESDVRFTYDSQGRLVDQETYFSDSRIGQNSMRYFYNTEGTLIRTERYTSGSDYSLISMFAHDEMGREIEETQTSFNGQNEEAGRNQETIIWKTSYTTDGCMSEKRAYSANGTETGAFFKYIYDSDGNIIQRSSNEPNDTYYYSYTSIQIPSNQVEYLNRVLEIGIGFLHLNVISEE